MAARSMTVTNLSNFCFALTVGTVAIVVMFNTSLEQGCPRAVLIPASANLLFVHLAVLVALLYGSVSRVLTAVFNDTKPYYSLASEYIWRSCFSSSTWLATPVKETKKLFFGFAELVTFQVSFPGVKGTRRMSVVVGNILNAISNSERGDVRPFAVMMVFNSMLFLVPSLWDYDWAELRQDYKRFMSEIFQNHEGTSTPSTSHEKMSSPMKAPMLGPETGEVRLVLEETINGLLGLQKLVLDQQKAIAQIKLGSCSDWEDSNLHLHATATINQLMIANNTFILDSLCACVQSMVQREPAGDADKYVLSPHKAWSIDSEDSSREEMQHVQTCHPNLESWPPLAKGEHSKKITAEDVVFTDRMIARINRCRDEHDKFQQRAPRFHTIPHLEGNASRVEGLRQRYSEQEHS
eukprot:CAMPEP_0114232908 /NCGR_PEP_ID=MMETSP0058-20121206/4867_1 /TAXON_ID=36894 /ORGANISM="Pyramimonas parkeae, CCMP726" /LENGTH=407 /DNA_ID=CAMNT_0001344433 /DNA_START=225 /DNA_END=1449 /DNA_ORIENTATION=+